MKRHEKVSTGIPGFDRTVEMLRMAGSLNLLTKGNLEIII